MNLRIFLAAMLTLLLFTRCKVSEKRLYGQWCNVFDTLSLKKDHTFSLVRQHYVDGKLKGITYPGTWRYSKGFILVAFDSLPNPNIFGGCTSIQAFNRNRLARSYSCTNKTPAKPIFYTRVK
ncbi:hypothetical protein [Pinibacter aurantiacus]|uniref:Uncharacterized protein n=1 Tax=Pinibacter aurantiacus TaxID=2851599 RepID=A0A9E2SC13_9BACT|nr:hypothetical protein [Pinibacter aurantiacus]MBV4358618.1 hypothetical protein [Pinibacter aurantiacus]